MISYNKSRSAWDFSQATDDEKEVLLQMAEDMLPSMLAQAIAKEMMVEALHEKKVIEEAYNSGNVVAGDFSKDKH